MQNLIDAELTNHFLAPAFELIQEEIDGLESDAPAYVAEDPADADLSKAQALDRLHAADRALTAAAEQRTEASIRAASAAIKRAAENWTEADIYHLVADMLDMLADLVSKLGRDAIRAPTERPLRLLN